MSNPVLVEVLRGTHVESRHRGALVVMDADGKQVLALGDVEQPIFPRSAVKSIQALPFVESGAADHFGFGNRELALACASHNGEEEHAILAGTMLERAGLSVGDMECGTHWPNFQRAALSLARKGGEPCALHNNCSGKHSGFLCTCVHLGYDVNGYVSADHISQELVRDAMESVTGAAHGLENKGIDGCSIPTYAVPLKAIAHGFARMATGQGLAPQRAAAAKRLFAACMAEPFYVAGTDRIDTLVMQEAEGRIMLKMGAEGVYCGAIPELGLGFTLKCDDGATRAAEIMVMQLLAGLLKQDQELSGKLDEMAHPILRNWNGIEVASLRFADMALA